MKKILLFCDIKVKIIKFYVIAAAPCFLFENGRSIKIIVFEENRVDLKITFF